mmetsp:Transcript_21105/g.18712  ORF Transcript_21105/g.18712 Transcript_21105/m.18712 type:complete len:132 (-) Transcript_21105:19-414(-)
MKVKNVFSYINKSHLTGLSTYYNEIHKPNKNDSFYIPKYYKARTKVMDNKRTEHVKSHDVAIDRNTELKHGKVNFIKRKLSKGLKNYNKVLNYSEQLTKIFRKNPVGKLSEEEMESYFPNIYGVNEQSIEY